MGRPAHEDDLPGGKGEYPLITLGDNGDPPCDLPPFHGVDGPALQQRLPLPGREDAGQQAEQSRFTRPVGTEDPDEIPLGKGESNPPEYPGVAITKAQLVDLHEGHDVNRSLRRSNSRKYGAPHRAVMTPTGSSAGATRHRARVSAPTRKAPPVKKAVGMRRR